MESETGQGGGVLVDGIYALVYDRRNEITFERRVPQWGPLFILSMTQYVSPEFLEKLKEELKDLKTNKRREGANRIEEAKALGDLSENAEYHEAKDALGFVEGRIMEIESILKDMVIVEHEKGASNVRVGATVKVTVNGKPKSFQIVGSNEADPLAGKISNESPIGSALMGAKTGDKVSVDTPGGTTVYEVVEIG